MHRALPPLSLKQLRGMTLKDTVTASFNFQSFIYKNEHVRLYNSRGTAERLRGKSSLGRTLLNVS